MKDIFNKNASILKSKKLYLLDMDGTIYNENTIFDGTLDLLSNIKRLNGNYVFITNNSSKGLDDYVKKVNNMGIPATKENFFTSTQATALLLNEKYKGKKVYCQGTRSMINELVNSGINITEEVSSDIDVVLIGFDMELTMEKLRKTCEILTKYDLPFYATNPDLRCPVGFGYIPDCGSFCKMIEIATGKKPIYIGKPEPALIELAIKKFNATKEDTVVIGDRLYTDIASGLNAKVTTICVLSGEATLNDIKEFDMEPTFVINSIKDISDYLSTIK